MSEQLIKFVGPKGQVKYLPKGAANSGSVRQLGYVPASEVYPDEATNHTGIPVHDEASEVTAEAPVKRGRKPKAKTDADQG